MPSSLPVKPRCSSVVALTFTCDSSSPSVFAIFSLICGICSASLGFCAITVASIFSITYPSPCNSSPTCASSFRLSAPSYAGSVSGKCCPISPSAAAPSSASITACTSTSASECPSSPSVCGISTPPKMSLRPSTRRCTSYPVPTLIFPIRSRMCARLRSSFFIYIRFSHIWSQLPQAYLKTIGMRAGAVTYNCR